MKKKILVYKWGSVSEPLFCEALQQNNVEYIEFSMEMKNYHADAAFASTFIQVLHANEVEAVFSYDYFPLISMVCEMNHIPYLCWIYDCPQYTLLSKTITNECNYIFGFDRIFAGQLAELGAKNCFHYPLAGDITWLEKAEKMSGEKVFRKQSGQNETVETGAVDGSLNFDCNISFVGNLYNDKKNRFRQAKFSPYVAGVAEGILQAQLLVYGTNFIAQAMPDEMVEEMTQKCNLSLGTEYITDARQLAADVLGMEVSARERELVLKTIGEKYKVRLYTGSALPEGLAGKNIEVFGYADYQTEVPLIFHNSKININITSKTIISGIPQRIFDILSCGGFCLTNYQPEIAEYFVDGKELVMYTDMADLLAKVEYYLSHEEERKQIAENGRRKIEAEHCLKGRVWEMLTVIE